MNYKVLSMAAWIAISFSAKAQLVEDITAVFNKQVTERNYSGTLLVVKNNEIIFEKSAGFSDDDSRMAFNSLTRSSLGSIGKLFTASIIMKLVDERKIAVEDVVNKYLLEFKIPNGDKISIKNLLTHTAGLGEYMGTPEHDLLKGGSAALDDLVKIISAQPVKFSPGEKFQYSNSGFIVLGKIIEKIEHQPYYSVLQDRILRPLEMNNSTFMVDFKNELFAKGYTLDAGKWVPQTQIIPPSSDGGLFTTASDLLKFDRGLFEGSIVSATSLEQMKPQGTSRYGYGMMTSRISNGIGYGHNGGMPGYEAEYRRFLIGKDTYTIIIMTNRDRHAVAFLLDLLPVLEKIKIN